LRERIGAHSSERALSSDHGDAIQPALYDALIMALQIARALGRAARNRCSRPQRERSVIAA
jgi:hypothetical protein